MIYNMGHRTGWESSVEHVCVHQENTLCGRRLSPSPLQSIRAALQGCQLGNGLRKSDLKVLCDHLEGWDGKGGREGDARGKRNGNILYMYN